MERKNAWLTYSEKQTEALEALSASYKAFLDHGKTERECVREAVAMAKEAGYVSLRRAISCTTPRCRRRCCSSTSAKSRWRRA